ncbi:hypothetical protein BDR03DRAFT_108363 [Suillus americanus]|nr:hypothetical protein BDR03DRAFT_108363 [Suillus americanus]
MPDEQQVLSDQQHTSNDKASSGSSCGYTHVLPVRLSASSNFTILPKLNYPFKPGSSSHCAAGTHPTLPTYCMAKSVTYQLHHNTTILAELNLCAFINNHYCKNVVPLSASTMTRPTPCGRRPGPHRAADEEDVPTAKSHHADHAISLPQCPVSVHSQICDQIVGLLDYP